MIEVKGGQVKIMGTLLDNVGDYIALTKGFRAMCEASLGEDADYMVSLCGKAAFTENVEEAKPELDEISRLIAKVLVDED